MWISRFDAAPSMEISYKKISIHGACIIWSAFFHFVVTTFSTVMKPVVIFSLVCLNRLPLAVLILHITGSIYTILLLKILYSFYFGKVHIIWKWLSQLESNFLFAAPTEIWVWCNHLIQSCWGEICLISHQFRYFVMWFQEFASLVLWIAFQCFWFIYHCAIIIWCYFDLW